MKKAKNFQVGDGILDYKWERWTKASSDRSHN